MPDVSVIERAFQIAKSGQVASILDLKKQLSREGYTTAAITGRTLTTQLQLMMRAARSISSPSLSGK